jgi:hypothetical protein
MDIHSQYVQALNKRYIYIIEIFPKMFFFTGKYLIEPRWVDEIESFKVPQIPKSHNLKITSRPTKIF